MSKRRSQESFPILRGHYDDRNIVAEYDQDGQRVTMCKYYVHGATYVDERVIVHDTGSNRDYAFVLDDTYRMIALIDDQGLTVATWAYDVYGARSATTPPACAAGRRQATCFAEGRLRWSSQTIGFGFARAETTFS